MAKSHLKLRARELRQEGRSIRWIAEQLGISKGSVSLWCHDITLTMEQTEKLYANKNAASAKGRLIGTNLMKARKQAQIESLTKEGKTALSSLSQKELLLAGLGVYWGEGYKLHNVFGFSNSDPELIRFMLKWLYYALYIPKEDIIFRIQVNEICHPNIDKIEQFWYKLTDVEPHQFRRPTYIKTANKKIYPNQDCHMGTLIVRVRRSSYYLRKTLGLIEGLKYALIKAA